MTVLPTALDVEAVTNGSETLTDTEDTFHDFALVMAALESARSGQAEIVAR